MYSSVDMKAHVHVPAVSQKLCYKAQCQVQYQGVTVISYVKHLHINTLATGMHACEIHFYSCHIVCFSSPPPPPSSFPGRQGYVAAYEARTPLSIRGVPELENGAVRSPKQHSHTLATVPVARSSAISLVQRPEVSRLPQSRDVRAVCRVSRSHLVNPSLVSSHIFSHVFLYMYITLHC